MERMLNLELGHGPKSALLSHRGHYLNNAFQLQLCDKMLKCQTILYLTAFQGQGNSPHQFFLLPER